MNHVSFSAGTDNTKGLPFSTQDTAPNRASQRRSVANALPVVPQDVQLRQAVQYTEVQEVDYIRHPPKHRQSFEVIQWESVRAGEKVEHNRSHYLG